MDLHHFIGQKIKEFRKNSGLTQTELAQHLQTTKQTVSRYENGSRKASQETLFALAQLFSISPNEFFPEGKTNLDEQLKDTLSQLQPEQQKQVLDYATLQLREQEATPTTPVYEYRIYERLSAGVGTAYYDDYSYDIVYHDQDLDYDIASWVYGDSMEPKFFNGEVALIKQTGFDYDGAIYAIVWDGQTYIKKVYREAEGLRLVSLNPKYSDKFAPYDEDPRIVGKIIGNFIPIER